MDDEILPGICISVKSDNNALVGKGAEKHHGQNGS